MIAVSGSPHALAYRQLVVHGPMPRDAEALTDAAGLDQRSRSAGIEAKPLQVGN